MSERTEYWRSVAEGTVWLPVRGERVSIVDGYARALGFDVPDRIETDRPGHYHGKDGEWQ